VFNLTEEEREESDFIWGVLSIIPGAILGSIVGWFIVGMLFGIIASVNPPGWSMLVVVPSLLLVFAGVIILFSIWIMRLYYWLGLPQNIEISKQC